MEKPKKSLCLVHKEAEKEIFDSITKTIQKHALPLFLAEITVRKALEQIMAGAEEERALAQKMYEQQIKEYEAENERGKDG